MATLTIAGVAQGVRSGTLRINESTNARNVMSFEVVSYNGTYRPASDAEVIYADGATRLFGGHVDMPTERGLVHQMGTRIVNGVGVVDFNSYADARHINGIIPAGTLKQALEVIVTYLTTYGVTLDGAQVTGPAVPLLYLPTRLIRDVLDDLSVMTGYGWEIDYNKVLRMVLPGSIAAPFDVVPATDPTVIDGDITVETVRMTADRIIVLAGSGIREVTVSFTGDTTTVVFPLLVAVSGMPVVSVNGTPVSVGVHGVDTEFEWTIRYSDNAIVQLDEAPPGTPTTPLTGSDTLTVVYAGQYPVQVVAGSGNREKVYEEPKTFELDAAQALADGYLIRHMQSFKMVRYATRRQTATPIRPFQTQTITSPHRGLSGTFMVLNVDITDTADQKFKRMVTAVGGTVLPVSWQDYFRKGGGGSGGAATAVGGGGGSGGGLGPPLSAPFDLGGIRNETRSNTPADWMPIINYRSYTATASFGGQVRAEVWARTVGVTIQVRLYNATESTVTATSSIVTAVTSMVPLNVPLFSAAITIGKTYRLEMLPGTSGQGVGALGHLEHD